MKWWCSPQRSTPQHRPLVAASTSVAGGDAVLAHLGRADVGARRSVEGDALVAAAVGAAVHVVAARLQSTAFICLYWSVTIHMLCSALLCSALLPSPAARPPPLYLSNNIIP